ncbi:MAG: DUF2203 domain-containing protein [Candidatus Limnocylindrales bacterium]
MTRYFGIDEANELLAEVKPLLEQLRADRHEVAEIQADLQRDRESNGSAEHAERIADKQTELRHVVRRMQQAVNQIDGWGVTLREIGTGLIDFPALANGRPILLCWRLGEGDIDWWHEVNVGFDHRQPLSELT